MHMVDPWKLLLTTYVAKVDFLDPLYLYLSNHLHPLPKLWKCQHFLYTFQNIKLMMSKSIIPLLYYRTYQNYVLFQK